MTYRYCACPKCGEISLDNEPEPSTAESYIQEFYCYECGYMECRTNKEYEKKAQLEQQRQQWWFQQDQDEAWINQQLEDK